MRKKANLQALLHHHFPLLIIVIALVWLQQCQQNWIIAVVTLTQPHKTSILFNWVEIMLLFGVNTLRMQKWNALMHEKRW